MGKFYPLFDEHMEFINAIMNFLPDIISLPIPSPIIIKESLENKNIFGAFQVFNEDCKREDQIIIYLGSILDKLKGDDVKYQIICTLVHEAYHYNYTREIDSDEFTKEEHKEIATLCMEYQTQIKSLNLILLNIDKFSKIPSFIFDFDYEFEHFVRVKRYSTILKYIRFIKKYKRFLMLHYDYIGGYKILQVSRILDTGVRDLEEVYNQLRFPKVTKKEVK